MASLTERERYLLYARLVCGCGLDSPLPLTDTLSVLLKKDLQTLRGAVNGEFFLDVKNPKLLKKVRRYYENNGVQFSGDALDDYDMLMEQVAIDLESVEVTQ